MGGKVLMEVSHLLAKCKCLFLGIRVIGGHGQDRITVYQKAVWTLEV